MNCCINCFSDPSLKSRIISLSTITGDCDFCTSTNIPLLRCEELSESFEQLFELYENNPDARLSLKIETQHLLHQHVQKYWPKLLNQETLDARAAKQLIDQIGRGWNSYTQNLFENPVELKSLLQTNSSIDENLELEWDSFAHEIKFKNRFFLNDTIDTEILESIFSRLRVVYPPETLFYRARLSDSPLDIESLGKPPHEHTTPGRANPVGIPYLYVSDSEKTTLYETRIALHEGITIGQFIVTEPLNLISLKNIIHYGPFEILDKGFTLEEFIRIRPYLIKLENELSKPVRKQDANLDYLPTQFLCEFIKSLGFDAVEFKSAMNPSGYNLAVFNDQKLKCISSSFYTVTDLKYKWE